MAEMEVLRYETPGIAKEIDEGAVDLVFDVFQEGIYAFPIKSFVREAISNGLDAIVERDIHMDISSGTPVETYYRQEKDDKLLKDSSYDPTYYSDKHLSKTGHVLVEYLMPEDKRRHTIRIIDQGVGLGGSRLHGFFKIGYSSKRNLKAVFGKFGAGAKAGLSTGVEYFIMRTVYNGWTSSFMIFKTDYEAITPKTKDSKVEVWNVKNVNGSNTTKEVYWEPTDEPNGVIIELEVKPHNRDKFLSAVTQQFQHFGGRVKLKYQKITGGEFYYNNLDIPPEYESKSILIPTENPFTVPTILVDGINYGAISWDELEMERRRGEICLKVHATDIDITQSRESLKWTEKTKKTILNAIEIATTEATEYTSNRLQMTDDVYNVFELNSKYRKLSSRGDDRTMAIFGLFLNIHTLKPEYKFDPIIPIPGKKLITKEGDSKVYEEDTILESALMDDTLFGALFYGYKMKLIRVAFKGNDIKIRSSKVENWETLADRYIVFGEKAHLTGKVAHYIIDNVLPQESGIDHSSFIYLRKDTSKDKAQTILNSTRLWAAHMNKYSDMLVERYAHMQLDEQDFDLSEIEIELDGAEGLDDAISRAKLRKMNEEVYFRYYFHDKWSGWERNYDTTVKIGDLEDWFKLHKEKRMEQIGSTEHEIIIFTQDFQHIKDFMVKRQFKIQKVTYLKVSRETLREVIPYGTFITDHIYKFNMETAKLNVAPWIQRLFQSHFLNKHNGFIDRLNNISLSLMKELYPETRDWLNISGSHDIGASWYELHQFLIRVYLYKRMQEINYPHREQKCMEWFKVPYMDVSSFQVKKLKFTHIIREIKPARKLLAEITPYAPDSELVEDIRLFINLKNQNNVNLQTD